MLPPHVSVPAHSESLSQSPPPTLHGLPDVQQLQSVLGTPLHELVGGCVGGSVGGCVGITVPVKYLESLSRCLSCCHLKLLMYLKVTH